MLSSGEHDASQLFRSDLGCMQDPGRQLRNVRERLRLRYRDVVEASQDVARNRGSSDFSIGLSRLADIENKGTIPSVYRLYSLCAIYSLNFTTVLGWYGVELDRLAQDSAHIALNQTHLIGPDPPDGGEVELPEEWDTGLDLRKTSYLTRHIHRWGKLPLALLNALDLRHRRYGFVGANDWSMYPIVWPGSFVQIDESMKRVAREGWSHENDRPIYFVEHRDGFSCGWCTEQDGLLIVQPHSSSHAGLQVFRYPEEADVVGRVIGVAMRLDPAKRRHTRS